MMKSSTIRRVFCGLVAALAMLAMPSGAAAGTYTISACSNSVGWANHAWSTETSAGGLFTTNDFCATGGSAPTGGVDTTHALALSSQLAAMPAPAFGYLRFDAPIGTSITGFSYNRQLRVFNNGAWRASTSTDDGELEGCQVSGVATYCDAPSAGRPFDVFNALNSSFLRIGGSCAAACSGGGAVSALSVAAGNINVTVTDPTAPTANDLTGSLPGGSALTGNHQVTVAGSDVVGVKSVDVLIDGNVAGSANNSCDYTYTRPCAQVAPSFSSTFSVNVSALAAGSHTLTGRVVDAANNMSTKSSTFTVYQPPVVPPPPPPAPPPAPPVPTPTPRNSYLRLSSSSINGKTLKVAGLIHSQASGKITVKLTYRDSRRKLRTKVYTASKSGQRWSIKRSFTPRRASMSIRFAGNSPWVSTSLVKSLSVKRK